MESLYWTKSNPFLLFFDEDRIIKPFESDKSCPLCEAGHKPTKKFIVPVIKLKKKYKPIIKKNRSLRRFQ